MTTEVRFADMHIYFYLKPALVYFIEERSILRRCIFLLTLKKVEAELAFSLKIENLQHMSCHQPEALINFTPASPDCPRNANIKAHSHKRFHSLPWP